MSVVESLLGGLLAVLFTALMAWGLAAAARRIMGAPVGWVRSGVICLLMVSTGSWLMTTLARGSAFADDSSATGVALVAAVVVLVFLWTFTLGLAALLIAEILVPTGSVRPVSALVGLRSSWRETRRTGRIVGVFARHGLGIGRRGRRGARPTPQDTPAALRDALAEAGVTFVKFGQMMSTRRDVVPAAYADALADLQSDVPPAPWTQIEQVITAALGAPIDTVFEAFEPQPLASASVGQVHVARYLGREVVVKVQRPGARDQVEGDLAILLRVARRLDKEADWARSFGVLDLAQGFAAALREELDYTVECENTLGLRAAQARIADDTHDGIPVRIPEVFPEVSSATLLVMERLDGTPVGRADQVLAGLDPALRVAVANTVLRTALRQLLVVGTFHADLHPGNVLVDDDGAIGLLDLGSVGRLGESERTALGALLLAIDADDSVAATGALLGLLDAPDDVDMRLLERSLGQIVTRAANGAGSTALFGAMIRLVTRLGMSVPPQVAAAFRTFTTLEGTLRLIDPGCDLVSRMRAEGTPLLKQLTAPARIKRKVMSQGAALAPELQRLPRRITRIVQDIEEGRLTTRVRIFAEPEDRAFITGLVRQVIIALIAAASVVGAVVLLAAGGGPVLGSGVHLYSLLGAALGLVGVVLGVRVLAFALRPTR